MARTKLELVQEYADTTSKDVLADDPLWGMSNEQIMDLLRDIRCNNIDILPQIKVMLCKDAKDYLDYLLEKPWLTPQMKSMFWGHPEWVAEEKLDGVRAKLHFTPKGIRIDSRRRSEVDYRYNELTLNFPHFSLARFPDTFVGTVLDGELLMDVKSIDTGKVVTQGTLSSTMAVVGSGPEIAIALQQRYGLCKFVCFDIIRCKSSLREIVSYKYDDRRAILAGHVMCLQKDGLFGDTLCLTRQWPAQSEVFENCISEGIEGVVLKNLYHSYLEGIRDCWWKLKKFMEFEGFITGYIPGDKSNAGLVGSLCVSAYDQSGEQFEFCAITGMTQENRRLWSTPEGALVPWMYNKVVGVRGQEITKNSRLRHAQFVEFREDKNALECKVVHGGGTLTQV